MKSRGVRVLFVVLAVARWPQLAGRVQLEQRIAAAQSAADTFDRTRAGMVALGDWRAASRPTWPRGSPPRCG